MCMINIAGSCGGTDFVLSYTPLSSPGYPHLYPPNLDCVWEMRVGAGQQVVVNVSRVGLEKDYDILRVYEGECCDTPVAEFTGECVGGG